MDICFGTLSLRCGILFCLILSVSSNHLNETGHDPAAIRLVVEDVIKGVLTKTFGNNTYGAMPDISELTKAVMLSQGYPVKPADTGTTSSQAVSSNTNTNGYEGNYTVSKYLNAEIPVKQTQQTVEQYVNTNVSQYVNEINKSPLDINNIGVGSSQTTVENNTTASETNNIVNNAKAQYNNTDVNNLGAQTTKYVNKSETKYSNNNQTTNYVTKSGADITQITQYVDNQANQNNISQSAQYAEGNTSNIQQYPKPMTEATVQPTYPTTATTGYLTTDPAVTTRFVGNQARETKTTASQGGAVNINVNSLPKNSYPDSQSTSLQYNDTQQTVNKNINSVTEYPSGTQPATQGTTQFETAATTSKGVNITSNPGKAYQEYSLQSSLPSADANQVDVVSLIEPPAPVKNNNQHGYANAAPPPKANILARLLSKLVGVNATEMDFFRFHNLLHHHPHVETTTTTTTTTPTPPTTTVSVLSYLLRDEVIAKLIQKLKMSNVHAHDHNNHVHTAPVQSVPSAISSLLKPSQTAADNATILSNIAAPEPTSILSPNGIMNLYPTSAPAYENISSGQNMEVPNNNNVASVQITPYVVGANTTASPAITTAMPAYLNETTTVTNVNANSTAQNTTSAYDNATAPATYDNATIAMYDNTTMAATTNATYEMTTNIVTTMDPDMVAELAEMAEAEAELLAEAEAEAQAEAEAEAEAAAETEPAV